MLGAEYDHDSTGMFLWGRIVQPVGSVDPRQAVQSSTQHISLGNAVSDKLLYEAGVFITPGFIFGKNGDNYIRISLCSKPEVLKRAAEKIKAVIRKD